MKKSQTIEMDKTIATDIATDQAPRIRKALEGIAGMLALEENQTLILTPTMTSLGETPNWLVGVAWELRDRYFHNLHRDAQVSCVFKSKIEDLRASVLHALASIALEIEKYRDHREGRLPCAWNCFASLDLSAAVHVQGKTLAEMHQRLAAAWPRRNIDHPNFHNTWHTGRWDIPHHSLRGFPIATDGWSPMEGQVQDRGNMPSSLEKTITLLQMDLGHGMYFSNRQPNRKIVIPRVYSDPEVKYIGRGEKLAEMIGHPFVIARPDTVKSVTRTNTRSSIMLKPHRNEVPVRMAAVPQKVIDRGQKLAETLKTKAQSAGPSSTFSLKTPHSPSKAFEPDAIHYPNVSAQMKALEQPAFEDMETAQIEEMANSLKAIYLDSANRDEVPWIRMAKEMKRQLG